MTNALTRSGLIRSSGLMHLSYNSLRLSKMVIESHNLKLRASSNQLALLMFNSSVQDMLKTFMVVSSVISGILSIEARDMDKKLLSAPESNNSLARCWFRRNVPVTTFGSWHDNLRILGAFLTQGKAFSIPTVFSWGDSISPDGFLPSILLWLVIIGLRCYHCNVSILVVFVVGEVSIIKLSFVIIGIPSQNLCLLPDP
ncbi:hypothetical protein Tco_0746603 [Tanacetum coccineum]